MVFPEEIRLRFKNYINNRTGLYFKDYDLKDIDAIVAERMKACSFDTVLAYYAYLTTSDKREDELRELLNRLTINHTYFFRNEPQFKVLKEKILPEIIERKGQEKPAIRIWSAGCSSGEEPYTIAMIVRDVIPDIENWDIQILATDASMDALAAARKGVYNLNSMRLVDDDHKARYFTETSRTKFDAKYAIHSDIKKMVSFNFFNLMDEDYPKQFDVIFCRNVTIYFELETTIRVMNKFAESLDDNGYLFIGYSETLQFISEKYRMISWEDAIFYTKSKSEIAPARFAPPRPKPIELKVDAILEEISKAEFEAEAKEGLESRKRSQEYEEKIVQAMKAILYKNYDAAISLSREAREIEVKAPEPYFIAAQVYTNQGRFKDAKEDLANALKLDAMYVPAHYLLGSIHTEEGDLESAEASYRKTLYLDKEFSLAHFGLANIYRDKGMINEALREYRNTLNILSRSSPYDIVAYSGGFNSSVLSGVCKDNIERLKVAG